MMELNPEQQRIVEEYLLDLNATQAAIRAGYSPPSARLQGHGMMTDHGIQNSIREAMDARSERTRIVADRVLEELSRAPSLRSHLLRNVEIESISTHAVQPAAAPLRPAK